MEALVTAMTTGLGDLADNAMSALGSIVPLALPIMCGVLVVTIGIRAFKKIASK